MLNPKPLISAITLALAAAPSSYAGELEVKKAFAALLKDQRTIAAVRKTSVLDLYEVQVGDRLYYTDANVSYVFHGDLIQVSGWHNLTEERLEALARVSIPELPLDRAIKTIQGTGEHVFYTFEDPNCGYCQHMAKEIAQLKDYTMYTFLVPTLSDDSKAKAAAIWQAQDRSGAWRDWMLSRKLPTGTAEKAADFDDVVALAEKLNVSGYPTVVLADGSRISGLPDIDKLRQAIESGSANEQ